MIDAWERQPIYAEHNNENIIIYYKFYKYYILKRSEMDGYITEKQ